MNIVKWGFIGCGEVTEKKSGPAFSEVEGSSVVAVMSRDERRARSYAERHGIPRWYTHSGILPWRIPWTEELGGLQSIGSQSQT